MTLGFHLDLGDSSDLFNRLRGKTMLSRDKLLLIGLLLWYATLSIWTAQSPADPQFWLLSSILPTVFVLGLIVMHRVFPLSPASYALITLFLTLHTIGAHYTYAQVPLGLWMEEAFHLGRNHFDRIVHFSFGFLLAYPMEELFRRGAGVRGWLLYYLPVMTVLGLSGLWEVIESWVADAVHPELGVTYLGSQGDIWDAQKDIAAALYGALLCVAILAAVRAVRGMRLPSQPQPVVVESSL